MDILKTIAADIQHSVFENDTAGVLYVTRDIYSDSFIVSVPVYSFSAYVWEDNFERDYKWIEDHFPGRKYAARLIEAIRGIIAAF